MNDRELLREELRRDRHTANLDDDLRARHGLLRTLVRLRKRRKFRQENVARFMSTTQSAVSDLENGITDVRLSTIQKYARALGCRVDFRLSEGPLEHFNSWQDRSLSYSHSMRAKIEDVDLPGWASEIGQLDRMHLFGRETRDAGAVSEIAMESVEGDAYLSAVSQAVRAVEAA